MSDGSVAQLDAYLTSPAFYADPYPVYHQLQTLDPVHWSAALGGWVLTRYDDVLVTLRDTHHFSSQGGCWRFWNMCHPPPGSSCASSKTTLPSA